MLMQAPSAGSWPAACLAPVLCVAPIPIPNSLCVAPQSLVASRLGRLAVGTVQRRTMAFVPALGSAEEMKAQSIEQIRIRVNHQKALLAAQDHGHDDAEEMFKWAKYSFMIGMPICALSLTYSIVMEDHPHRHEGPEPAYMKVRIKEFPWRCPDCDLLDYACWDACKAEKAAAGK